MSNPLVPETTRSEGLAMHAARAVSALLVVGVMVAAMWALEVIDYVADGRLDQYGIQAHRVDDLPQIFSAPFLHAGFGHLMANTVPFIVLAFLAAVRGVGKFLAATLVIVVVGGLGVWFTGPEHAETLGASILVFGYFGYLVGRGLFERHLLDAVMAVVVVLLYGTIVLGVLPSQPGISWQGHLFGLLGGVLAAWTLRRRRVPVRASAAAPIRP